MASEHEIDEAVQSERERCLKLMECYDNHFKGDKLEIVWIRVKNQISLGTDPSKAGFFEQILGEDEVVSDRDE